MFAGSSGGTGIEVAVDAHGTGVIDVQNTIYTHTALDGCN